MTITVLVAIAVFALPVIFVFSATACADLAGVELPAGEPDPPYDQQVLQQAGLIGYWRLGEPEHAVDAINSLPPGSHKGAYSEPAGFELQKAGALKHDGNAAAEFAGGYVEIPFDPPLTPAALTVELWLKVPDSNANVDEWRDVIGCYVPNSGNPNLIDKGFRIRVMTVDINGTPALGVQANLGGMATGLSQTVGFGDWHYVALTYAKASGARMHIDQKHSPPVVAVFPVIVDKGDGQTLRFGGNAGDSPLTFTGVLDEIALYGRALDEETLEKHYKQARE